MIIGCLPYPRRFWRLWPARGLYVQVLYWYTALRKVQVASDL